MPTDWEKLKVAELKEECKSRDIPLTGLKLKQQYIDKLVEHESQQDQPSTEEQDEVVQEDQQQETQPNKSNEQPDPNEHEPGQGEGEGISAGERTNGLVEDQPTGQATEPEEAEKGLSIQPARESTVSVDVNASEHAAEERPQESSATENISLAVEADKALPQDRPPALKMEDSQGLASEAEKTPEDDVPMADTVQEAREISEQDMLEPQDEQLQPKRELHAVSADDQEEKDQTLKEALQVEEAEIVDPDSKMEDSTTSTSTPAEESRKRKRRSLTPPPDSEEITKKAKAIDGGSLPTKRSSPSRSPIKAEVESTHRDRSPSYDKNSTVEPAIHHATRSLYMKNFKRPFAIALLREHVETIARGSSALPPGENPIVFYNLNALRSHVFVKLFNISIASRVRAEMHGRKFPDDGSPRDDIWADFVPDDKVEEWVDYEQSRDRRASTKVEVQYSKNDDGVMEATFKEVSIDSRPNIAGKRDSFAQRQPSYNADPTRVAAIASGTGVHPDRASMLPPPRSPDRRRSSARDLPSPERPRRKDTGIGFAGLDDLFESTSAKPKLYYKLPPQKVIDERLDLIADLYDDRGAPGVPGMKRYTFEKERGRDAWVDNGPEFGHGRKGQDRLLGVSTGRGRGGYRGGRANYRGYGGRERDVYRGEGRR